MFDIRKENALGLAISPYSNKRRVALQLGTVWFPAWCLYLRALSVAIWSRDKRRELQNGKVYSGYQTALTIVDPG